MKKILALALAGALSLGLLAGCGGGNTTASGDPQQGASPGSGSPECGAPALSLASSPRGSLLNIASPV